MKILSAHKNIDKQDTMDVALTDPSPLAGIQFSENWSEPMRFSCHPGFPINAEIRDLLCWEGSLTERLEKATGSKINLQLINHDIVSAWPDSVYFKGTLISLPAVTDILVRDAWLLLDGRRMVFAHSQIVLSDLSFKDREIILAGQQALGHLFMDNQGRLSRVHLQLNRLHTKDVPYLASYWGRNPCWCRRSWFCVDGLLRARILEVFPPDLLFRNGLL
ncbi:MAG: chorismate lyase [Magnetococcales bacterium]|nr:chorismate lyase [Magnetococcales bacterium]